MTIRESIRRAHVSGPQPKDKDSAMWEFCFPADDPTFAGHFPTRPLLPGIFQLEIARFAAEKTLNCRLAVREIIKAKFLRPIIPAESVRVELKWSSKTDTIQVRALFTVTSRTAGEVILQLARGS